MVAAAHVSIISHGHVARDTAIAGAIGFVVRVFGRVLDAILVTREASAVRIALGVAVASGGSVAVDAIELAGFDAGAERPGSIGVVLADVAAIGIVVSIFVGGESEMIVELVAGAEAVGEESGLGVAGATSIVALGMGEIFEADEAEFSGSFAGFFGVLIELNVFAGGAVAGFTVDAGLEPSGVVGVRGSDVVGFDLADVAAIARGIEGERTVAPLDGFGAGDVFVHGHAAGGVHPCFFADVVGERKDLEESAVERSEEVIDVFTAESEFDGIAVFAGCGMFNDGAALVGEVGFVSDITDADRDAGGEALGAREFVRITLHREAVEGGGPEIVELFMARGTSGRADVFVRRERGDRGLARAVERIGADGDGDHSDNGEDGT